MDRDLLLKCLELINEAESNLECDKEIIDILRCQVRTVQRTQARTRISQMLAKHLGTKFFGGLMRIKQETELMEEWERLWNNFDKTARDRMQILYNGNGTVLQYVILLILKVMRNFDTKSNSPHTADTSLEAPKVIRKLPAAAIDRYRALFANFVRKARIQLSTGNGKTSRDLRHGIEVIIDGLCAEECGKTRRMSGRAEAYEILQLVDQHAMKNFHCKHGANALRKLVNDLCQNVLLRDQIMDVLVDTGLNVEKAHVSAFLNLLLNCTAPSLWKYIMEQLELNEKHKGGVSFRTRLKMVGVRSMENCYQQRQTE